MTSTPSADIVITAVDNGTVPAELVSSTSEQSQPQVHRNLLLASLPPGSRNAPPNRIRVHCDEHHDCPPWPGRAQARQPQNT